MLSYKQQKEESKKTKKTTSRRQVLSTEMVLLESCDKGVQNGKKEIEEVMDIMEVKITILTRIEEKIEGLFEHNCKWIKIGVTKHI